MSKFTAMITLLNPKSEERQTMSDIASTLTMLFGAKLSQTTDLPALFSALKGEKSGPPWLIKAASFIGQLSDDPGRGDAVMSVVFDFLRSQGVSKDRLFSLFNSLAPALEVPVPANDQELVRTIRTLAKRVTDNAGAPPTRAIIICPKCNHTHLV